MFDVTWAHLSLKQGLPVNVRIRIRDAVSNVLHDLIAIFDMVHIAIAI